ANPRAAPGHLVTGRGRRPRLGPVARLGRRCGDRRGWLARHARPAAETCGVAGRRVARTARPRGLRMTFLRLRWVDWVAFIAALALLFFMSPTWYTTKPAEANRAQQHRLQRLPPTDEGDQAQLAKEAGQAAKAQERNAWRPFGTIDRVVLIVMLVTVGLAVAPAFFRAAGRCFEPPWTPSGYTALAATLAALLVAYR